MMKSEEYCCSSISDGMLGSTGFWVIEVVTGAGGLRTTPSALNWSPIRATKASRRSSPLILALSC